MKPIIKVQKDKIMCNGFESPYDHPAIYLHMRENNVLCPYCSKTFILEQKKECDDGKSKY